MRCSLPTAAALLAAAGSIAAALPAASAQTPAAVAPDYSVGGPARISLRNGEYQVHAVSNLQVEEGVVPDVAAPAPQLGGYEVVPVEPVDGLGLPSNSLEAEASVAEQPQAAKLPGELETAAMIGPMRDAVQTFSSLEIKDDWRYYVNVVPQGPRPIESGAVWPLYTYTWQSPAFYYRPLYFEQPNLERYGQGTYRALQPVVSAAHFFGTVPLLPVKAFIDHPLEPTYSLGHYRPGNCAPVQRNVLFEN